jgi:carbon monoxide dehydrogenase subunit G
MIMAERKFVIGSPRQRIWELLLKAALMCMPLERLVPQSATKIQALLRVKMGFISLPMDVEVEIVNMSPPVSMEIVIKAKGVRGIIWLNQRATFILTPISEGETEIACKLAEEGMATLLRLFLLPTVKSFARDTFNNLEERLKKWA